MSLLPPPSKRFLYGLLSLIFLCLQAHSLLAQAPFMRQIGEREGLPSQITYEIKQDQQGFIWLGTDVGIFRYDGYTFQGYEVPEAQGVSFSDFKEDRQGRIFFTNFSGQLFFWQKEKITALPLPEACKDFGILDYDIDSQSRLWLVADFLYCSDNLGQSWRRYHLPGQPTKGLITKVAVDKQDALWVLADALYALQGADFVRVSPLIDANNLFAFGESIWASDEKKSFVYEYNTAKKQWSSDIGAALQSSKEARIVNLYQDQQQNLWVLTLQGALCFAEGRAPSLFMKDKFVAQVLHDREGNYWFATIGDGLFMAPNIHILNFTTENSFLPSNQINCLAEDEIGNLLVGSNSNVAFRFNLKEQVIHRYYLPKGDVECLLYDPVRHQIFIESEGIQLFDFDASQAKEHYYLGSSSKQMLLFKNEYLIAAAGNGCFVRNLSAEKTPQRIQAAFALNQIAPSALLRPKRSRAVAASDALNTFWVAYADDLYAYKGEEVHLIKTQEQKPIIALSLAFDPQSQELWVGTAQQGLLLIKNNKVLRQYTTSEGLLSNLCKVVKIDGKELWIGTDKGLQVLDTEKNTWRSFGQQDGLVSNEIKDLLVQEKRVWVATLKGLTVFDKNLPAKNTTPPRIYLNRVAVAEQERPLQQSYALSYKENNLYIGFCGLSFKSGGNFSYKYRLKGLSDVWLVAESKNNFARYPSLPPGQYTFEVKAINEDGVESLETATLTINIAAPFWKKWWFSLSVSLVAVLVLSALFYARMRTLQRRNALEMKLKDAYLIALKAQMNPHFLFNVLNSIKGYIYENDKKNAVLYLNQFADLMRKVLVSSDKKQSSLAEELELLRLYIQLEAMLLGEDFSWQLEIADGLDTETLYLPPLLLQPFVENAFKHGLRHKQGAKTLLLRIEKVTPEELRIYISDNGIGRAKARSINAKDPDKAASFALENIQNRIALINESHHQKINIEIIDQADAAGQASGTCVVLTIAYGNNATAQSTDY